MVTADIRPPGSCLWARVSGPLLVTTWATLSLPWDRPRQEISYQVFSGLWARAWGSELVWAAWAR